MEKSTLIAVAVSAALTSGLTQAQTTGGSAPVSRATGDDSYLRMGGSVDTVVRRDAGAPLGATWSVGPGVARSSRFGFSIKELIAPGRLAGTVVLEGAFAPDSGAGASNPPGVPANSGFSFGRTAHVGVGHDSWGYITAGRQYTPLQAVAASPMNDPFGGSWLGGIATVYNKNTSASNTIVYSYGYTAEAMLRPAPRNGLGVAAMYAFGEVASPLDDAGNQYGFNVSYGGQKWWGGYGFHRQVGNSAAINPAVANAETPEITHHFLGGAYEIGTARISVGVNSGRNDTGSLNRRNWHVGLAWGVHERGTVRALYGRANDRTAANGDFSTVQLSYMYDLSRRTGVYVAWGRVNNSAATAVTLAGSLRTVDRGASASSVVIGVRHSF